MQNQIIEQLTTATSKSYETMKNLGDINTSALRKITDLQFDFISMNVESGIEQAKSLNNKTDAKDFFASSAEFVSDYNEKMIGFTSQTVEILNQSRNEATSLFEKAIATKAAPAKKPAKAKAAKPAAKKAAKKAA
jgi:phasin family protein